MENPKENILWEKKIGPLRTVIRVNELHYMGMCGKL